MEISEYRTMVRHDRSLWWSRHLRRIVIAEFRRHHPPAGGRVLDAGCGAGGLMAALGRTIPGLTVVGIDRHPLALAAAARQAPVAGADISALPFADESFDAIFCTDVLCHRQVAVMPALAALRRCLKPAGLLILNVPAYGWLYSRHDRLVHNARRFARQAFAHQVEAAGLRCRRATYWNTTLFPLMALHRIWPERENGDCAASDTGRFGPIANALLYHLTTPEYRLLRAGVTLPFGGSLLVSATRN